MNQSSAIDCVPDSGSPDPTVTWTDSQARSLPKLHDIKEVGLSFSCCFTGYDHNIHTSFNSSDYLVIFFILYHTILSIFVHALRTGLGNAVMLRHARMVHSLGSKYRLQYCTEPTAGVVQSHSLAKPSLSPSLTQVSDRGAVYSMVIIASSPRTTVVAMVHVQT